MGIENPVHLLFVATVALVVLGPRRLPDLARSLGKGIREFRDAMSDGSAAGASHTPAPSAPVAPHEPVPVAPTEAVVVAPHEPVPVAPTEAVVVAPHEPVPVAPTEAVVVAPPFAPASPPQVDLGESAPPRQVDPGEPVRSGDAPDRRPL
jgi:TatA/E family protein of Tat protein translocase